MWWIEDDGTANVIEAETNKRIDDKRTERNSGHDVLHTNESRNAWSRYCSLIVVFSLCCECLNGGDNKENSFLSLWSRISYWPVTSHIMYYGKRTQSYRQCASYAEYTGLHTSFTSFVRSLTILVVCVCVTAVVSHHHEFRTTELIPMLGTQI